MTHREPFAVPAASHFQFSIRALLATTTVLAFITAEAVVFPNWVAGLAGILGTITAAALATIVVIHAEGHMRTLAIGALFPLGWMLLAAENSTSFGYFYGLSAGFISHWAHIGVQNRHAYVVGWLFSLLLGIICVIFRSAIERGNRSQRDPGP